MRSLVHARVGATDPVFAGQRTGLRFHPYVPTTERETITAEATPLIEAGYQVMVEPAETTPAFGWDVSVDRPGRHAFFRIQHGASRIEWAQAVVRFLYAAHQERKEARRAR